MASRLPVEEVLQQLVDVFTHDLATARPWQYSGARTRLKGFVEALRRRRPGVLVALAALIVVPASPAPASAAPSVVGTIPFPGNEPLEVEVYETGNKILVTEDNTGKLYIFDGASHQLLNSVDVGSSAIDMVVNETYGKAYVASDGGCCSTGFTQGTA